MGRQRPLKAKQTRSSKTSSHLPLGRFESLNLQDFATDYHLPVLTREVLAALLTDDLQQKERASILDCTLGGGGHSSALLQFSSENTHVYSIDRDPDAIDVATHRLHPYQDRWTPILGNYQDATQLLHDTDIPPVDALLLDAGVSSHQLDHAPRGFSFRNNGPLDMRMGPDAVTIEEWLDSHDEEEIGQVIGKYGEMPGSFRIARAIKLAFTLGQITDTRSLAAVVERCVPTIRKGDIHPATLVFQALRIAVNDELNGLESLIQQLPDIVRPGGRIAIIAFHSLEDRIVKQGFAQLEEACICPPGLPICACHKESVIKILTKRPVTAQQDELDLNPRARSAKLRVAVRK